MTKKAQKKRKEIRFNPSTKTFDKVKLLAEKQNNSMAAIAELLIEKQLALIEL